MLYDVKPHKTDNNRNPVDSERWLTRLTQPELAHWEAKPQSEKDWWYANTKPEDRREIVQAEIAAAATHNELLQLPQATRNAITKRLSEQADAARVRIRERFTKQSRQGE
jgi:hypothetical protein